MTSVERILEYIELPSEHGNKSGQQAKERVERDWPNRGHIDFKGVSLKYDEKLDQVLKDVCVEIQPGEKVGIIGRTGAGKSSFIQTLFRLYEPTGTILIDNVDTSHLSLHDLRSRLTIIPVCILTFYLFILTILRDHMCVCVCLLARDNVVLGKRAIQHGPF